MGPIVAGLSPEDFAPLDAVRIADLTQVTLKHLTQDHLKLLTPDQIQMIPKGLVPIINGRKINFNQEANEIDTDEVKKLTRSLS